MEVKVTFKLLFVLLFYSAAVACEEKQIMESLEIPKSVYQNLSEENRLILKLTIDNFRLKQEQGIKAYEYELRLKEQELKLKEQEFKFEKQILTDQLSTANWKILRRENHLNVKSFIDFVAREHLYTKQGSKSQKFKSLAQEKPDLLEKWKISLDSFGDVYDKLYKKVCESPHPFFDYLDDFVLSEADLEERELKLLGFIWSAVPLNENKIHIRKLNNEVVNLVAFIEK